MSNTTIPHIVSNGRGGWLCSVCGGGVRSDATTCKHCRVTFFAAPDAHAAYQGALATLKADPTNADLRERALSLGRTYAAMTRQGKHVTIFDEMALSNDIAAATAGAARSASAEERLNALEGLRTKGMISDAEYAQKRQKLLDEM